MPGWPKPITEMKPEKLVYTVIELPDVIMDPPQCVSCHQGHLVLRRGPYGEFYSCNRWPDCKATYDRATVSKMYDPDWEGLMNGLYGEQPF
jgi:hypothetical protein